MDACIQHDHWRLTAWGFGIASGLWAVAAVISLYGQSRFAILNFSIAFLNAVIALGYCNHRRFIPAKGWFEGNRLHIRTIDPWWRRLAIISRNLELRVISVEQDEDAIIVTGAGRWESLGERYRIRLKPGTEGMAELTARLTDMKQSQ